MNTTWENIMRKDVLGVGTLFAMMGVIGIITHLTNIYTRTDQSDKLQTDCELEDKKEMLYAKRMELIDLLQQITLLKKELVSKADLVKL
jgi:hypothetical protein